MKKITKEILLWTTFVAGATAIGVASYFIIKQIKEKNNKTVHINNWENVPNSFKEFSTENAFKITLPVGGMYATSGTAWSWYYEKTNDDKWDWYLITNFHVVNGCVGYINNFSNSGIYLDSDKLLDYYSNNVETYIPDKYNVQLSIYKNNNYSNILKNVYSNIDSISIITDFNNNNIDLFSKSNLYNLDMALVKLTLLDPPINNMWNKPNIINMYKQINNKSILLNNNNTYKYIAGNPAETLNELAGVLIDSVWEQMLNPPSNNDEIYKYFNCPYLFTINSFQNFVLEKGSSGSAVYQVLKNDINNENYNLSNEIPIGIFWGGGQGKDRPNEFWPSFIPFYNNEYNIYDNFINVLTNK